MSSRTVSVKEGQELTLGKSEDEGCVMKERYPRNDGRGSRSKRKIVFKEMECTSSSEEEEDEDKNMMKPPMPKKKLVKENGAKSQPVLVNGKKVKVKELELTSSEEDDEGDGDYTSAIGLSRAQSPTVPEGQYEIEDVVDYVKDPSVGDMYLIKWKKWEPEFNTWEPPANLVNCDDALLNFYWKRKKEVAEILKNSSYYSTSNGQRRRKGPPLPDIPPDPRPLYTRLEEFFQCTFPLTEEEVLEKYPLWNKRLIASKGKDRGQQRWAMSKVNKWLQDGIDGKLSGTQLLEFRKELVYVEMERRKADLNLELKRWELKINNITQQRPVISVENDVDFEGPPKGFEFVTDYVPANGIIIPSDPPVGCNCGDSCYEKRNTCCAKQFGANFAYTKYRKVAVPVGTPIYECNRKCKCSSECPNRVVQDGKTDCKLSIFRTSNGCGWGVKATKSIKKGCFVTLYVGEVITNDEAEMRGKKDGDGHTYLFDLDFNDKDEHPYSVDASKYGNVAHFINHSCNPNLAVYNVWVDCLDPNLPKLAMFAARDIAKGEELSFDYINQVTEDSSDDNETVVRSPQASSKTRKKCLCGASNCRRFLFI